jgi:hypothetical protein
MREDLETQLNAQLDALVLKLERNLSEEENRRRKKELELSKVALAPDVCFTFFRLYEKELDEIIQERRIIFQDFDEVMRNYDQEARQLANRIVIGETEAPVLDLTEIMKNQYLTKDQVEYWKGITDGEDLEIISILAKLSKHHLSRLKNVADYGCGEGHKSLAVYRLINNSAFEGNLNLIDFSSRMLWEARSYCIGEGNTEEECIEEGKIPKKNVHVHDPVNLEKMGKILKDKYPTLHLFIGQTIGNFEDEIRVVDNIAANMKMHDYLAVEWFRKEPEDYKGKKFENFYRELLNNILGIPEEAISGYDVELDTSEGIEANVMSFTVNDVPEDNSNGYWEINQERTENEVYKLYPGTKIVVSKSKRFSDREVTSLFEKANLETVLTDGKKVYVPSDGREKRYALFRKKKEKKTRPWLIAGGLTLCAILATIGIFGDSNNNTPSNQTLTPQVIVAEADIPEQKPLDVINNDGRDDDNLLTPKYNVKGDKEKEDPNIYKGKILEDTSFTELSTRTNELLKMYCDSGRFVKEEILECTSKRCGHWSNISMEWKQKEDCSEIDEKDKFKVYYSDLIDVSGKINDADPSIEVTYKGGESRLSECGRKSIIDFYIKIVAAPPKYVMGMKDYSGTIHPNFFFQILESRKKEKINIPYDWRDINEYTLRLDDKSDDQLVLKLVLENGDEDEIYLKKDSSRIAGLILDCHSETEFGKIEAYYKDDIISWKKIKKKIRLEGKKDLTREEKIETIKRLTDVIRTYIQNYGSSAEKVIENPTVSPKDDQIVDAEASKTQENYRNEGGLSLVEKDKKSSRTMEEIVQCICKESPVMRYEVADCRYSKREYIDNQSLRQYEIRADRGMLIEFSSDPMGIDQKKPCTYDCIGFYLDTQYVKNATITPISNSSLVEMTITHNFSSKWKPFNGVKRFESKTYIILGNDAEVIKEFLKPWVKIEYLKERK